jgi:hypothetical protein
MGSGLNIQQLDHSDTTSEVTYTYDRRGRRATAIQKKWLGRITTTLS